MSKETKVVKNPATAPGIKYGGRVKGTPNKDSLSVAQRCAELGVDPVDILCHFANGDHEKLKMTEFIVKAGFGGVEVAELSIPAALRLKASSTLVKYIHPERKAVEHSVDKNSEKSINFNYTEPKK